ncbi:MAG TPA: hypothetical protein VF933_09445 [Streptosporangiaceae bacterium]
MSYEFTLVLSREITAEESESLQKAGCAGATVTADRLPTDADVIVTRLDFDTEGPSLAEVITSALEAVKTLPDLSAASLTVPPQPNGAPTENKPTPAEPAVSSANGDSAKAEDAAAPAKAARAPRKSNSASGASRGRGKQPKRGKSSPSPS